jgi:hypothetical protein
MFQSFQQNFPTGAIVAPQTGLMTTLGKYFLQSLWSRTGSATGLLQVATGLTAAGTTQATALALGSDWNQVTTVPAGSGVALPAMQPGADIIVWNAAVQTAPGQPALLIYPFSGAAINNGAVNVPFSLPVGQLAYIQCWSLIQLITAYINTMGTL